jgi:hypothetical protein
VDLLHPSPRENFAATITDELREYRLSLLGGRD